MAKIIDGGWLTPKEDEPTIVFGSAKEELKKREKLDDVENSLSRDDKEE